MTSSATTITKAAEAAASTQTQQESSENSETSYTSLPKEETLITQSPLPSPDSLEQELLQALPNMPRNSSSKQPKPYFKKRGRRQPVPKVNESEDDTTIDHTKPPQQTSESTVTSLLLESSSSTSLANPDQQQQKEFQESSSTLWSRVRNDGRNSKKGTKHTPETANLQHGKNRQGDHHDHCHHNSRHNEDRAVAESLLINTSQRVDSQELNNILGFEGGHTQEVGGGKSNEHVGQEKKNGPKSAAPKSPSRRKTKNRHQSGSPKNPKESKNSNNERHRRHLSEGAILPTAMSRDENEGLRDDDQTVVTVMTLWDMKETFQKEFPGQDLPSDEALRQRYRNRNELPRISTKHNKKQAKRPPQSPVRTSKSPTTTKANASVKTVISNKRWGTGSNEVSSPFHCSSHSSGRSSLGCPSPKESPLDHGQARYLESDFNETSAQGSLDDPLSKIPVLPFSVHKEESTTSTSQRMVDADDDVDDFGEDIAQPSSAKEMSLSAPIQIPTAPKRVNSLPTARLRKASNKASLGTPIQSPTKDTMTAPNTWAAGNNYYGTTQTSFGLKPPSSAKSTTRKPITRNPFFKSKLRSLLRGNEGEADQKPLMLLDDSEHNAITTTVLQEQKKFRKPSPLRNQRKNDTTNDAAMSSSPSKNRRSFGSSAGSLLSSVLGRGSGSFTDFGELDCHSSDEDNIFMDEEDLEDHALPETLSYQRETKYVEVTVALNDDKTTIDMNGSTRPRSTSDLSTTQNEQDSTQKRVEEARVATRRNRRSNRHRRSQSPDTRISSPKSPSRVQSSKSPSGRSRKAQGHRPPIQLESFKSRSERRRSRSQDVTKVQSALESLSEVISSDKVDRQRGTSTEARSRRERSFHSSSGIIASHSQRSNRTRSDRRRARSHDAQTRKATSDDASRSDTFTPNTARQKSTRSEHSKNTRNRSSSTSRKQKSDALTVSESPILRRPSGELDDIASMGGLHIPTQPVDLKPKRKISLRSNVTVRSRREAAKNIRERQHPHENQPRTKALVRKCGQSKETQSSTTSSHVEVRPLMSIDPGLASPSNRPSGHSKASSISGHGDDDSSTSSVGNKGLGEIVAEAKTKALSTAKTKALSSSKGEFQTDEALNDSQQSFQW